MCYVHILYVGIHLYADGLVIHSYQALDTAKERYGEAIGYVAHSTANKIATVAHDLAEPASKKEIRVAKEILADRNGRIYRFDDYSHKDRLKELLEVDDKFKQYLYILGLTEYRWQKIAKHLLYIGVIRYLSREHSDFPERTQNLRVNTSYMIG